uniref:BHLH domain-containing protein n=1 Tax=Meloidogyne javanica TaxID=6303 RepID=A0A915MKM5_MELJA
MTSNPHSEISPDDEDEDVEDAEKPVTFYKFGPQKTQSIAIDVSLNKLNKCIRVAYMKMTTPKWKDFKGIKLQWKHRIRLNNVIWRAYYMEFRKPGRKRRSPYCYFSVPDDDMTHVKIEGSVLEGMYWKRSHHSQLLLNNQQFLRSMTPDNLSTMATECFLGTLFDFDDDMDNEFTNQLFEQLNAPFLFPNPKEETSVQCDNADILQPGLLSLQPSIEEIMSTDFPYAQHLHLQQQQLSSSPSNKVLRKHQKQQHLLETTTMSSSSSDQSAPFIEIQSAAIPQILTPNISNPLYSQAAAYETQRIAAALNSGGDQKNLLNSDISERQNLPTHQQQQSSPSINPPNISVRNFSTQSLLSSSSNSSSQQQRSFSSTNSSLVASLVSSTTLTSKNEQQQPSILSSHLLSKSLIEQNIEQQQQQIIDQSNDQLLQSLTEAKNNASIGPQTVKRSVMSDISRYLAQQTPIITNSPLLQPSDKSAFVTGFGQATSLTNCSSLQNTFPSSISIQQQQQYSPSIINNIPVQINEKGTRGQKQHIQQQISPNSTNIPLSPPTKTAFSPPQQLLSRKMSVSISSAFSSPNNNLSDDNKKIRGSSFSSSSLLSSTNHQKQQRSQTTTTTHLGKRQQQHNNQLNNLSPPQKHQKNNVAVENNNNVCLVAQTSTTNNNSFIDELEFASIGPQHKLLELGQFKQNLEVKKEDGIDNRNLEEEIEMCSPFSSTNDCILQDDNNLSPPYFSSSTTTILTEEEGSTLNICTNSAAADSTLNPDERKRILHLNAEKNRRSALKEGFDCLVKAIPLVEQAGLKSTNAVVLNRAAQHIKNLKLEQEKQLNQMKVFKEKIACMNERIAMIQANLPSSNLNGSKNNDNSPTIRIQVEQFFERYKRDKSHEDYRFWLMSEVIKPIVYSFAEQIYPDGTNRERLLLSTKKWLDVHWNSGVLRPIASDTLVRIQVLERDATIESLRDKVMQINDNYKCVLGENTKLLKRIEEDSKNRGEINMDVIKGFFISEAI